MRPPRRRYSSVSRQNQISSDSRVRADGLDDRVDVRAGLGGAAAETGADVDAIVEAVRVARESLDIWFALDTLEYLRRGGRIGAAQALLGSALKIKPILTFGTEIAPVGRVRTTGARTSGWSPTSRAARPRRDRLDRPACAVARGRRPARRRRQRDLRLRAAVLHPGRPRARRAPRLGDAGRRDGARLKPFRIAVPEAELDDLRARLRSTRWPEAETVDDWSQGIPLAYLQRALRATGPTATTGGRPRRG